MNEIIIFGNLYEKKRQSGAVYSYDGICPVLCAGCHSYGIPFILIDKFLLKQGEIK